jgi:hypothetical protein
VIWPGVTWTDLVRGALVVAAALLTISANWDYFREVRADVDAAKPRVVSWLIWTGATLIGAGQAARAGLGQIPAVCYDAACAAGCAAIVVAAWRRGDWEVDRLDRVCLWLGGGALAALAASGVWPALIPLVPAVALSVAADFIAYTPTFRHGWKRPDEEPWRPYAKFTLGAGLTLAALLYTDLTRAVPAGRAVTGAIYPAYLLAANAAMVVIVLATPYRPGWRRREGLAVYDVGSGEWRPVA